jgi:UDP-N-acetylglucosamine--N-acetylmuramyl-(pentapeptide) pyrophosphoryl-undecaprenol N-acetylglucosamine transferase
MHSSTVSKRILFTGGHLTPALAVIEKINNDKWELSFIGRENSSESSSEPSIESSVIPALGVKFYTIPAGRLQRRMTLKGIKSLLRFPRGVSKAYTILSECRPDLVVSFGGYVGFAVGIAAFIRQIPVLVHEQTVVPGLSNRITALFARKIAISWPDGQLFKHIKHKVVFTGNPVRSEILTSNPKLPDKYEVNKKLPIILIVGGNQGSHALNQAVIPYIHKYSEITNIFFQTGSVNLHGDYEQAKEMSATSTGKGKIIVQKYFYPGEFGSIMHRSDIVVGRSGANTITEIALLSKPSILIPLPWSAGNEQLKNAELLSKMGSQIIPQSQLTPELLFNQVYQSLKDIKALNAKARETRKLVNPKAAEEIVHLIDKILYDSGSD